MSGHCSFTVPSLFLHCPSLSFTVPHCSSPIVPGSTASRRSGAVQSAHRRDITECAVMIVDTYRPTNVCPTNVRVWQAGNAARMKQYLEYVDILVCEQ